VTALWPGIVLVLEDAFSQCVSNFYVPLFADAPAVNQSIIHNYTDKCFSVFSVLVLYLIVNAMAE
jgi:hypothetical protein